MIGALTWLAVGVLLWAPFMWCCCGSPVCNWAVWPSTIHITTNGKTIALTYQAYHNGIYNVWTSGQTFTRSTWTYGCSNPSVSWTTSFDLYCADGELRLRYNYTSVLCSGTCYLQNIVYVTEAFAYANITSFANSPFSFSGTWDSSGVSSPCALTNPLAGLAVSGTP